MIGTIKFSSSSLLCPFERSLRPEEKGFLEMLFKNLDHQYEELLKKKAILLKDQELGLFQNNVENIVRENLDTVKNDKTRYSRYCFTINILGNEIRINPKVNFVDLVLSLNYGLLEAVEELIEKKGILNISLEIE